MKKITVFALAVAVLSAGTAGASLLAGTGFSAPTVSGWGNVTNSQIGDILYDTSMSTTGFWGYDGTTYVPLGGASSHNLAVTTKTANYTVVSTDEEILVDASGGAFTLTLPAASVSGKAIYLKKIDTSTNAVTIQRAGSDTIEGVTSRTLNTLNESYQLVSDGSSHWDVLVHKTNTPWTTYTVSVTATTTNPTKGSSVGADQGYWRRVGDSIQIRYVYRQNSAGSAGSGNYLFSLPSGITIDSTKAISGGLSFPFVVGSGYQGGTGAGSAVSVLLPGSSDFSHLALADKGGVIMAGSGSAFSFSDANYQIGFDATIPVSGWSE